MDHQDAADRAADDLSADLYGALAEGDPATIIDTPAYSDREQPLREVVSTMVCGAEVCDPLIRALAAAIKGEPNARELASLAINALVSAHVTTHADAATAREAEREEVRALEGRHGRCEWDNPRAYA